MEPDPVLKNGSLTFQMLLKTGEAPVLPGRGPGISGLQLFILPVPQAQLIEKFLIIFIVYLGGIPRLRKQ
jgi:hypothetical protein